MEKCSQHNDRPIKYYCSIHTKICCDLCKSQQHKSCKDVRSVEELSKNITTSEEYWEVSKRLKIINSKSKEILFDAEDKMKLIEKNYTDLVKAVKKTRKELNEALDEIEKGILQQAEAFKQNNVCQVNTVFEKFRKTGLETQAMLKQMENMQTLNQEKETFIFLKRSENKLKEAEDMIVGVNNEICVKGYMFLPNESLKVMLQKPRSMGKFYPDLWTEHEGNIKIRTRTDTCRSWITGSAALPDKIVVTDYGNSKVKVIDAEKLCVLSDITVQSRPWAVAKVSEKKVAVTVPYVRKIIIIRIDAAFPIIEKEIGTSSKCQGIAYWDGRFIVTFSKKDKVEVIDMSGTVLHTIVTEITGQKLFNFPEYVSLSPSNQVMYVSNYCDNSVISIGLDGKIKGVFKDEDLLQPRHTTADSNKIIYICGYGSNNIVLMSQDLKKVKTLLAGSGNLNRPRSVCVSEKGNRLFVDQCPDMIKVFKVSHFLTSKSTVQAERKKSD